MAPQICNAQKTTLIDNVWLMPAFSSFHCYQIVTLSNHPLNLILRHRTIQNNRVPMLFILMISRNHGRICTSPQIPPFRIHLNIDTNVSIPFIRPQKSLFMFPYPDKLPVRIMKWRIHIGIWKCQTILQYFFSRFHFIILLQNLISHIFRHAGKIPISPLLYLSTKKQIRLLNKSSFVVIAFLSIQPSSYNAVASALLFPTIYRLFFFIRNRFLYFRFAYSVTRFI